MSQRDLGDALGWSQSQVKKLENMQTENVGVVAIEELCRKFKVPWGYFHAPGSVDLDPGAYMLSKPQEIQIEALMAHVDEQISKRIAETDDARKKEPPSGARPRFKANE